MLLLLMQIILVTRTNVSMAARASVIDVMINTNSFIAHAPEILPVSCVRGSPAVRIKVNRNSFPQQNSFSIGLWTEHTGF